MLYLYITAILQQPLLLSKDYLKSICKQQPIGTEQPHFRGEAAHIFKPYLVGQSILNIIEIRGLRSFVKLDGGSMGDGDLYRFDGSDRGSFGCTADKRQSPVVTIIWDA